MTSKRFHDSGQVAAGDASGHGAPQRLHEEAVAATTKVISTAVVSTPAKSALPRCQGAFSLRIADPLILHTDQPARSQPTVRLSDRIGTLADYYFNTFFLNHNLLPSSFLKSSCICISLTDYFITDKICSRCFSIQSIIRQHPSRCTRALDVVDEPEPTRSLRRSFPIGCADRVFNENKETKQSPRAKRNSSLEKSIPAYQEPLRNRLVHRAFSAPWISGSGRQGSMCVSVVSVRDPMTRAHRNPSQNTVWDGLRDGY